MIPKNKYAIMEFLSSVIADSDKDIKVKQEDNDPSQNPMDSIKAQLNNTVVYDTTSIVPDVSDSSSDIEL